MGLRHELRCKRRRHNLTAEIVKDNGGQLVLREGCNRRAVMMMMMILMTMQTHRTSTHRCRPQAACAVPRGQNSPQSAAIFLLRQEISWHWMTCSTEQISARNQNSNLNQLYSVRIELGKLRSDRWHGHARHRVAEGSTAAAAHKPEGLNHNPKGAGPIRARNAVAIEDDEGDDSSEIMMKQAR